LGVLPSRKKGPKPEPEPNVNQNLGAKRMDETIDDKKSRKFAVKAARRQNRERKKALKVMYDKEQMSQQSVTVKNQNLNPTAVRM